MSIKDVGDLLRPAAYGRMDADIHLVDGELWVGRDTGPRVRLVTKSEGRRPWAAIRGVVVDRLEEAERVLGRTQ